MDGQLCLGRVGLAPSHKCWSQTWLRMRACSAGIVVEAELDRIGTRTCGNVEMQIKEQLVMLFTK